MFERNRATTADTLASLLWFWKSLTACGLKLEASSHDPTKNIRTAANEGYDSIQSSTQDALRSFSLCKVQQQDSARAWADYGNETRKHRNSKNCGAVTYGERWPRLCFFAYACTCTLLFLPVIYLWFFIASDVVR